MCFVSIDRNLSLLEVQLSPGGPSLVVYGVWMPFDDCKADTWASIQVLLSRIHSLFSDHSVGQKFLIIGDWNMDLERSNRVDKKFSTIVEECDLSVCDHIFSQQVDFTYHSGT